MGWGRGGVGVVSGWWSGREQHFFEKPRYNKTLEFRAEFDKKSPESLTSWEHLNLDSLPSSPNPFSHFGRRGKGFKVPLPLS